MEITRISDEENPSSVMMRKATRRKKVEMKTQTRRRKMFSDFISLRNIEKIEGALTKQQHKIKSKSLRLRFARKICINSWQKLWARENEEK